MDSIRLYSTAALMVVSTVISAVAVWVFMKNGWVKTDGTLEDALTRYFIVFYSILVPLYFVPAVVLALMYPRLVSINAAMFLTIHVVCAVLFWYVFIRHAYMLRPTRSSRKDRSTDASEECSDDSYGATKNSKAISSTGVFFLYTIIIVSLVIGNTLRKTLVDA